MARPATKYSWIGQAFWRFCPDFSGVWIVNLWSTPQIWDNKLCRISAQELLLAAFTAKTIPKEPFENAAP